MTRNHKKPQDRIVRQTPLKYRPLEKVPAGQYRSKRRGSKVVLDIELALSQTNEDPKDYILWFDLEGRS